MKRFIISLSIVLLTVVNGLAESFTLVSYSDIYKDNKDKVYNPNHYNRTDILFDLTPFGLTIHCELLGTIKLSRNLLYEEEDKNIFVMYSIYDLDSFNGEIITKGFSYAKRKDCWSNNPCYSSFILTGNDNIDYCWRDGVDFYDERNSGSNNLHSLRTASPSEDKFVKFIKSLGKKNSQSSSSSSSSSTNRQPSVNTTPSSSSNSSTSSISTTGEYKIPGYTYTWDDYRSNGHDRENGSLTIETRSNHYIGVSHNIGVTNISPNRKEKTKWSTRKGAIKISLPKGVSINNSDEIISWELNGNSTDPNFRQQVLFIYTPSTGKIQCINNTRRKWAGRTLNDVNYFRTINASAWPIIKSRIMAHLLYCGNEIN